MVAPLLSCESSVSAPRAGTPFQTPTQCVSVAGQKLRFADCTAPLEPDQTLFVDGNTPHGISLVATCPSAKLFAFTERVMSPTISVHTYPDMQPHATLQWPTPLEFSAIAFSRDGTQLAAVTGLPEPTLVIWSLESQTVLASAPLHVPCDFVSFNPAGDGSLCTLASKRLLVWKLRLVYETYLLESTEVPLEEEDDKSATAWTAACWAPGSVLYASAASLEAGSVIQVPAGGSNSMVVLRGASPIHACLADATHLVLGAGDGSIRWYGLPSANPSDGEELRLIDDESGALFSVALAGGITALSMAPDFLKLLATTTTGDSHLLTYMVDTLPLEPAEVSHVVEVLKVASYHTAPVLAAAALPITLESGSVVAYDIVSASSDGTLRCIDALTREQVACTTTASSAPPSALATSAASSLVALGTADGVLRLYTRRVEQMPLLFLGWRKRLARSAITHLAFSADGAVLACSCADGVTFFLKLAMNAEEPILLPHITTPVAPCALTFTASGALLLATPDGFVRLVAVPSGSPADSATVDGAPCVKLPAPCLALLETPPTSQHAASAGSGATHFYAACIDGMVHAFAVPKNGAVGNLASPLGSGLASERPTTSLALSEDTAFLAAGTADGAVIVAPTAALADATTLRLHDSIAGGVAAVALVPDVAPTAEPGASRVYSCGKDASMFLTHLNPNGPAAPPAPMPPPRPLALKAATDKDIVATAVSPPPVDVGDEAAEEDAPATAVVDAAAASAEEEATMLEEAKAASNVGATQSAARDALASKVDALREELLALIAANAALPDDDLEKLSPADFIIDVAQQGEWRAEGSAKVEALKAAIAEENLTNELVTSRMRSEFWDAMEAPLVTLHAMVVPAAASAPTTAKGAGAKVTSYTVPKPLPSAQATLAHVKLLRRVEVAVDAWEGADNFEPAAGPPPSYRAASAFEEATRFAADIGRVVSKAELQARADAEAKTDEKGDAKTGGKRKGDADAEEEGGDGGAGGEGGEGGGPAGSKEKLVYPPFELHPKLRKVSQMALHGEVVQNLKREFNAMLSNLLSAKRAELEKVKERQLRIGEIELELGRLGSASDGEETLPMGMHEDEEPEKLLEVKDEEISAPKFLSKAEREKAAKEEAERLAREAAAQGDNLGKRGLEAMMNGTLETRREEDEIFVELVKPAWMSERPADEMTDDEKQQVKDFEDAQKKLLAEREKRAKGLLTELAKLRLEIVDICRAFNDRVVELRETKMAYDGALYECELLIIRLAQARLHRETFEKRSIDLDEELVSQRASAGEAAGKLAVFNVEVGEKAELVEGLAADDKGLEKAFKRDFADVPEAVDQLRKLFNRRKLVTVPKGSSSGGQANPGGAPAVAPTLGAAKPGIILMPTAPRTDASGGGAVAASDTGPTRDPFATLDGPSTEQAVQPLDPGVDMPEGLSFDVWDRLVDARSSKIASEERLKSESATLVAMQEYQQLLDAEDATLRGRIEELSGVLSERREQELSGAWNLELPFKLRQGQVEVAEAAVVTDFGGSVLVHRSEVEELNSAIKTAGSEKVQILREIRDFRKGIVMLEWENQRADMEAEDLVSRTKEFQLLRVTKDLQSKISGSGGDTHAIEAASLEKKLEALKASHEDKVADLRRQVAKLNTLIADRNAEMESLSGQIEQLEGSVLEREMIHEIQSSASDTEADGNKRFEELHMKRKLQTLVGMQTQEIGLLREELDRLRRRTFPTFTHLERANSADHVM